MKNHKKKNETVVIIPTYNGWDLLQECIQSLQNQTYKDYKILVINDGSEEPIAAYIDEKFNNIDVLTLNTNKGFVKAVNSGIEYSIQKYNPTYIALLNNDTVVTDNWLFYLVGRIKKNENIAAVTSNMLSYDNKTIIDSQGGRIDWNGDGYDLNYREKIYKGFQNSQQVFSACFGASLLSVDILKDVGLLDDRFYAYYDDIDWSWRSNILGYKIYFEKEAIVYHHKSKSWNKGKRKMIYISKRNCLTSALKNYEIKNLFNKLKRIFVGYILLIIDYIFFQYNLDKKYNIWERIRYVIIPFKATIWNILHLPKTIYQRIKIQQRRKTSDQKIFSLMTIDESQYRLFKRSLHNKLSIGTIHKKILLLFKKNTKKLGINILGYIDAQSGIGESVRSIINSIRYLSIPYVLNNETSSPSKRTQTAFNREFTNQNPYPINIISINGDTFYDVMKSQDQNYLNKKYNIVNWVWELEEMPQSWIPLLNNIDEIWTPSNFSKKAFEKYIDIPIFTIPHSIRIQKIPFNRNYFSLLNDSFIFLFIFDFLSHFERKNPLAVINAFQKAFPNNSNVQLILKSSNGKKDIQNLKKIKKETEKDSRIIMIDKYLTKNEINSLINVSDVYVSLHRSEGFGLTIAEAMALGKPVIATNYSGNTDFMNKTNSFPIDYKLENIKNNHGPYKKGNKWAKADIMHAAQIMKKIYENPEEIKTISENATNTINLILSPESVSKKIENRLKEIYSK